MIARFTELVRRGVFSLIHAATRTMQVRTGANEAETDVPLILPYGFACIPTLGSNALLVNTKNGVLCFSASEPDFIPEGLVEGDVALYDKRGQLFKLSADGISVSTPAMNVGETPTALLKEGYSDALKAQLELCTVNTSTGEIITESAFLPGWDSSAKTTILKGE